MASPRDSSDCGDGTRSVSPGCTAMQLNVAGQLELLKTAAPRLSPQPLLLCFPLSACGRVPRLSLSSPSSCPTSVGSFDDVIALESKAAAAQVKKQSRLSTSLPHALFEALRGRTCGPYPVSFDVFVAHLAAKAQAALQRGSCDVCSRGDDGADEGVEASRDRRKGGETVKKSGSVDGAGGENIAICVVPQLDPARGRVILTPPQRVCGACFRILHLPHLLAVSVASVVSAAPLTRSVFSDVLEHFATVNGYTSLSVAGARLQQAISLAFSVSLLKKQINWRLERLSSPSLDAFFSCFGSRASPSSRSRGTLTRNSQTEDLPPNGVPTSRCSQGKQQKISAQSTVSGKRRRREPTYTDKRSDAGDTSQEQAKDLDRETSKRRQKVKKGAGSCEAVPNNEQARKQVLNNSQRPNKAKKRKQTA